MICQDPVLLMENGEVWHKAKKPPYKHAMAGISSQTAYGDCQKIRHTIPPWPASLHKLPMVIAKKYATPFRHDPPFNNSG